MLPNIDDKHSEDSLGPFIFKAINREDIGEPTNTFITVNTLKLYIEEKTKNMSTVFQKSNVKI